MDEILVQADELSRHSFGHHTIRAIVEHGTSDQRHSVACALYKELFRNANHRNASLVVEKALEFCSTEDQMAIAAPLLQSPASLKALAENQFGCYVVKAVLRMQGEPAVRAQEYLQELAACGDLQSSKCGQWPLREVKVAGHPAVAGA